MVEENKKRWNELPKEIRRRFTPGELDSCMYKIITWYGKPYHPEFPQHPAFPEDQKLRAYQEYIISRFILYAQSVFDCKSNDDIKKVVNICYDSLLNYYEDLLTREYQNNV